MAECDWIVLCDYAFAGDRGKLGVIGIFDRIFAQQVPATHERCAVAFSLLGEPGEQVDLALQIIGPNGAVVAEVHGNLILPDEGSGRAHFDLRNLVLTEFGQYVIQLDAGDRQPKTAWFALKQTPLQR